MSSTHFVVYVEQDEDGMYIGSIPSLPGCHAQGVSQAEMLANLTEVVKLCLRNLSEEELGTTHFVGIENLDLTHA